MRPAVCFAALMLLCTGAAAKYNVELKMSGVTTTASGSNYITSGTVVVTNTGDANAKIQSVQTLYFITGTTWAPTVTNATCLLGSSGAITLAPGNKLNCQFSQQMPKSINGKATVPGMIYAKAFMTDGNTATSPSVTVSGPSPSPPPPATKLSVTTQGVKTSASGGNYVVSGSSVVKNTGSSATQIKSVVAMLFVTGTTWAPYQATATCLVGASGPITLQPGNSLNCQFVIQMPKSVNGKSTLPGTLYSKAFAVDGTTASSGNVNVMAPVGRR